MIRDTNLLNFWGWGREISIPSPATFGLCPPLARRITRPFAPGMPPGRTPAATKAPERPSLGDTCFSCCFLCCLFVALFMIFVFSVSLRDKETAANRRGGPTAFAAPPSGMSTCKTGQALRVAPLVWRYVSNAASFVFHGITCLRRLT